MSAETCPVVSLKISHSTCLQILKTRHLQTWKLDDKHVRWMWWNRILLECQKHMECSPRRLPVWVYQWFAETLCAQNLIVVMGCVASMLLFTTISTWSFWLVFGTWRCHQAKKKKQKPIEGLRVQITATSKHKEDKLCKPVLGITSCVRPSGQTSRLSGNLALLFNHF